MDYITSLKEDITQTFRSYKGETDFKSLYLGGGTPNILSLESLEEITRTIEKSTARSLSEFEEVTLEVNPGLSDLNYLKGVKELGFNRLSIGVQSLDDRILTLMKRIHRRNDALKILGDAVRAGFLNISADLIYNFPTEEDPIKDLDTLLTFPLTHISAYSLSLEKGTLLYSQVKRNKLPFTEEGEREKYLQIGNRCRRAGIEQYEISNYARTGYESRQNTLYWTLGSYFGLGPASSSFVDGVRVDHPPDLYGYLKGHYKSGESVYKPDEKELKQDFMIFGLRQTEGVKDSDYREIFGSSFFDDFRTPIEKLIKEGFLTADFTGVKLTPHGLDFADRVALDFL